jgi:hypothetical protein
VRAHGYNGELRQTQTKYLNNGNYNGSLQNSGTLWLKGTGVLLAGPIWVGSHIFNLVSETEVYAGGRPEALSHRIPVRRELSSSCLYILKNVRPNQPKAGTTRFHAYATLSVINKGKCVTLALTLAHKGEKMDQIVKRLMARARELGARHRA